MLTQQKINRIEQSKRQTQSVIDKEMKYSEEFRNHQLILEYQEHLSKLDRMLKG